MNPLSKKEEGLASHDIWWDDEGCWVQCGPQAEGPFSSEEEALDFASASEGER